MDYQFLMEFNKLNINYLFILDYRNKDHLSKYIFLNYLYCFQYQLKLINHKMHLKHMFHLLIHDNQYHKLLHMNNMYNIQYFQKLNKLYLMVIIINYLYQNRNYLLVNITFHEIHNSLLCIMDFNNLMIMKKYIMMINYMEYSIQQLMYKHYFKQPNNKYYLILIMDVSNRQNMY